MIKLPKIQEVKIKDIAKEIFPCISYLVTDDLLEQFQAHMMLWMPDLDWSSVQCSKVPNANIIQFIFTKDIHYTLRMIVKFLETVDFASNNYVVHAESNELYFCHFPGKRSAMQQRHVLTGEMGKAIWIQRPQWVGP